MNDLTHQLDIESGAAHAGRHTNEPTIDVRGLRKQYRNVVALDNVTFSCDRGEIFGLLGPNGAGKTTLIEILEGLRTADAGSARILSVDASSKEKLRAIRAQIGIAMQKAEFPPLLTVADLLDLYTALYPTPLEATALIRRLSLEEKQNARVTTLSGGQLQRLSIALALVGDPSLVFLDEPTSQLDPQSRRAVWDLLLEFKRKGRSIILTTHSMEDAQHLCDRVAILDHGRILAIGKPSSLIEQFCPDEVVRFLSSPALDPAVLGEAAELAPHANGQVLVSIRSLCATKTIESVLSAAKRRPFPIENLRTERLTLEDVFLKLTGKDIRN